MNVKSLIGILVLLNCNGKPFEMCVYIIDSNAHHLRRIMWYIRRQIP